MPVTLDKNNAKARALLDGQAHLYICNPASFEDVTRLQAMRGLLSDDELARLRAFKFECDSHSFLISHVMLRKALSNYACVDPQDWSFVVNEHDKPSISRQLPQLAFNLTHADGLCAVVITAESVCGIDVENVRRQNNIEGIAQKMFAATEVEYMLADEGAMRDRFFSLWTLRESFVKALGTGLAGNSDDFHFIIDEVSGRSDIVFTAPIDGSAIDWKFQITRPTDDHVMSVCVDSGACNEIVVIDAVGI